MKATDSDYFLWPRSDFNFLKMISYRNVSVCEIENTFRDLYPGTFPVLFSSARSALVAILKISELNRNDHVWIPPYSSHCVISSVAAVATPTPIMDDDNVATLIYHQWGIPFCIDKSLNGLMIEDSVDSLCLSPQALFPNDGRFELLSLPKIIGSVAGGIVLCKKESDAEPLKSYRGSKISTACRLQFLARTRLINSEMISNYWSSAEIYNKALPKLALKDIFAKLSSWDALVADRKDKIKMIKKLGFEIDYKFNSDRLPSNWIVKFDENKESILSNAGFSIGKRNIMKNQRYETVDTQEVLPIPLHAQVQKTLLEKTMKQLLT